MVKAGEIERVWYLADADGRVLGRFASKIAQILRGKHKPIYSPHLDLGDYVIVVNAEKIRLTGDKEEKKVYYWHTGYPGGLKSKSFKDMIRDHPDRVIYHAVKGMLPHNRLGRRMIKKLKVYAGPDHPHGAQKPQILEI